MSLSVRASLRTSRTGHIHTSHPSAPSCVAFGHAHAAPRPRCALHLQKVDQMRVSDGRRCGGFCLFVFPARGSAYNSDWIVWRRPLAARVWEHLACSYSPSVVVRFAFGILVHESPVGAFAAATDLLAVGITQTPALLSTFVHHRCCRCSFCCCRCLFSTTSVPYDARVSRGPVLSYCRFFLFFFAHLLPPLWVALGSVLPRCWGG